MPQQGDTNEGSLLLDRCNLGDQRLRAVAALNYEQAGIGRKELFGSDVAHGRL